MKFTRELAATLAVRSVSADGIHINDRVWSETVALTPEEIIGPWHSIPPAELTIEHFSELFLRSPELLIVGSGAKNVFPPRDLMFAFARRGVGLEVMDTAAAARTFNVLAAEGRRIVAVLYPP